MSRKLIAVWACAGLLAAGAALGHEEGRGTHEQARSEAPGALERGLARVERAMARLETRLSGRGGSMMDSCADMMTGGGMMGGGMMGGSQPNERWRSPGQ